MAVLDPVWAMSGTRRTTGEAIADLTRFVALDDAIDLTIGSDRGFWTDHKPERLVTNDASLLVEADHHIDITLDALPLPDKSFAVAAFDPPYRMSGTSSTTGMAGEMNDRYGVDRYRSKREIWELYAAGITEAVRLARQHIVVKCMNQTSSGAFQPQTHHVWWVATELECVQACALYVVATPRAQPAGRGVLRPAANVSELLVFEVPR